MKDNNLAAPQSFQEFSDSQQQTYQTAMEIYLAYLEAVRQHRPQVVGLSAFLTTTMPMIKVTIEAIRAAGQRDQVRILAGGAPVNAAYAELSGADAYCPDASTTARTARQLIAGRGPAPASALAEGVAAVQEAVARLGEKC